MQRWAAAAALCVAALGCTDDEEKGGGPPVIRTAERVGNAIILTWDNARGVYAESCGQSSQLVKASGEPWIDETPECGAGSYVIDGVIVPNEADTVCSSCQVRGCVPFTEERSFAIGERFRNGVVVVSDAGVGDGDTAGEGAMGGRASDAAADDGGADAGIADAGIAGVELPAYESRPYTDPLLIVIRYHDDSRCAGPLIELPPMPLEL